MGIATGAAVASAIAAVVGAGTAVYSTAQAGKAAKKQNTLLNAQAANEAAQSAKLAQDKKNASTIADEERKRMLRQRVPTILTSGQGLAAEKKSILGG